MKWWVILVVAGIFEMTWVAVLKAGHSTERHWPKLLALAISAMSMFLLDVAMRKIPMGTSYAVWTGIGALGTSILGILFFGEPFNWIRVFFVLLIVSGLVGLKLSAPERPESEPATESVASPPKG